MDCNPNFAQALPLLGRDEIVQKVFLDKHTLDQQGLIDNQRDARRRASNDGFHDHLIATAGLAALLNVTQTAADKDQTTTGAEETEDAGVGASAQAIATSLGNLLTAAVPIITAAGGIVTAQTLAAVLPALVTAIGGSSTPSQTTPKS